MAQKPQVQDKKPPQAAPVKKAVAAVPGLIRPIVSFFNHETAQPAGQIRFPHVFLAPIRSDIVHFVHDQLSKNRRQAHGVQYKAGMKHSAESWGTGRAVARIPRISGSGTSRSGQAAFGNMVRKGRMAHPLRTWRRWHRKVNLKQRRHALASAIAATAVVPFVFARGHRVQTVPQLPLVVDDNVGKISKTKAAVAFLKRFGAYEDVLKVVRSKTVRAGRLKARNKRYNIRKGPLFIGDQNSTTIRRALKNIPGVNYCSVKKLNLLQLAPGGQLGRFCIWTKSAFESLDKHFGTWTWAATHRRGYTLQQPLLRNAEIDRLINSDEIQRALLNKKIQKQTHPNQKKNPLRNRTLLNRLNPYAKVLRELNQKNANIKKPVNKDERKKRRSAAKVTKKFINSIVKQVSDHSAKKIQDHKDLVKSLLI